MNFPSEFTEPKNLPTYGTNFRHTVRYISAKVERRILD